MSTLKFDQFLESESRGKTYTAEIPYPRMTVECVYDTQKIRDQFENLPTAQQLYDKCKDVKLRHMDSWLMKWFGSRLISPESADAPEFDQPFVVETLPDFINAASYTKQESLSREIRLMLRDMRPAYLKLTSEALSLRSLRTNESQSEYDALVSLFNSTEINEEDIVRFEVLDITDATDSDEDCSRVKLLVETKSMTVMVDWDNVSTEHVETLDGDMAAVVDALKHCVPLGYDEVPAHFEGFHQWTDVVYCVVV